MDDQHITQSQTTPKITPKSKSFLFLFTTLLLIPFLSITMLLFWAHPFDPAPFPDPARQITSLVAPKVNARILVASDFVGSGQVDGPEDMAYEPGSRIIYTGCADGWIKRLHLGDSLTNLLVEDWVNTGGRPLGLYIHPDVGHIIVADAYKGLLEISKDKEIKVLSNEANGERFKLTDGIDGANDGTIYFTDASYKYPFHQYVYDILEHRPYGRLLSFDPKTGETQLLLSDLYFPNGIVVSPNQDSLIFCETPLRRCTKYWIQGSKRGSVDTFIDNLPGFPDNIHYDGHNSYMIAISSSLPTYLERMARPRVVRKSMGIMERYIGLKFLQKSGGVFTVDLEGNPVAHFYDPAISSISSGIKINDQFYIGSLYYPHIIRFNFTSTS